MRIHERAGHPTAEVYEIPWRWRDGSSRSLGLDRRSAALVVHGDRRCCGRLGASRTNSRRSGLRRLRFHDFAAAEAAGYGLFYVCTDETGEGRWASTTSTAASSATPWSTRARPRRSCTSRSPAAASASSASSGSCSSRPGRRRQDGPPSLFGRPLKLVASRRTATGSRLLPAPRLGVEAEPDWHVPGLEPARLVPRQRGLMPVASPYEERRPISVPGGVSMPIFGATRTVAVAPTSHHTRPGSDGGSDPVVSASTHPRDDPRKSAGKHLGISRDQGSISRRRAHDPDEASRRCRCPTERSRDPRAPPAFGAGSCGRSDVPDGVPALGVDQPAAWRPKPDRRRPNATAPPAEWAARTSPCSRPHARAGGRAPGWRGAQRPLVPLTGRGRRRTRSGADRGRGRCAAGHRGPGCRCRARSDSPPCDRGRRAAQARCESSRDARRIGFDLVSEASQSWRWRRSRSMARCGRLTPGMIVPCSFMALRGRLAATLARWRRAGSGSSAGRIDRSMCFRARLAAYRRCTPGACPHRCAGNEHPACVGCGGIGVGRVAGAARSGRAACGATAGSTRSRRVRPATPRSSSRRRPRRRPSS